MRAIVSSVSSSAVRRVGSHRPQSSQQASVNRRFPRKPAASPLEEEVASETPVTLNRGQLQELFDKFPQKDGKYDLEVISIFEEEVKLPVKDWFPEDELEAIYKQGYVDFHQFSRLCEVNLILEGKLKEYRKAFNAVDTSGNGSIGYNELVDLLHFLNSSLSDEKLSQLMVDYDLDKSGQIEFPEFLMMFRDDILDLKEVLKFTKDVDQSVPRSKSLIQLFPGEVTKIFGEDEFDEIVDKNRDKLVVVFAGLTWCRPCKGINRSYEKFAEQYKDAIFVKFFGNSNSSTKSLFINRLKAEATPAFFFYKNKALVTQFTGNHKEKLEKAILENK